MSHSPTHARRRPLAALTACVLPGIALGAPPVGDETRPTEAQHATVTVLGGTDAARAWMGTGPDESFIPDMEVLDLDVVARAVAECGEDRAFDGMIALQSGMGWRAEYGPGTFRAYPATPDGEALAACVEQVVGDHVLEAIGTPMRVVREPVLFTVSTTREPVRGAVEVTTEGEVPPEFVELARNAATQCAALEPVRHETGWNIAREEGEAPTGGLYLKSWVDPEATAPGGTFGLCATVHPQLIPLGSHQLLIRPRQGKR